MYKSAKSGAAPISLGALSEFYGWQNIDFDLTGQLASCGREED
jgi:hypothetical protein